MLCQFVIVCIMSDILSPIDNLKFQENIKLSTNHSPSVFNRTCVDRTAVAVTLQVSSNFLISIEKYSYEYDINFVDIFNTQVTFFQLKRTERLESRFKSECSRITGLLKHKFRGGRQRQDFLNKTHNFIVFKDELCDIETLNFKVSQFDEKLVQKEKKCKDIFEELIRIKSENSNLKNQLNSVQDGNSYLKSRNKALLDYTENVIIKSFENSGKRFDELSERQQYRKLNTLGTYAEKALAFAETFGLKPLKLDLKSEIGKTISVSLNENKADKENLFTYENLNSDDKDKLRQLVFILDKFCVSDAAYHELSMIFDDMPRKYLLVQCREDLNKIYHIERLPGNKPGVMINIKDELKRLLNIQINKGFNSSNKLQIKFSGDGAKVSKISNYVIFSLAVLNGDTPNLSYNQLNTVAIVKCDENYDNLRDTCKPLFQQLSELDKNKTINVGDQDYEIEIFVGGDMKFLQILLGLGGSTGDFACPWCKVHKNDRHDLTKHWNFYHSSDLFRSYEEICFLAGQTKNTFGVKHKPLLKVNIDHFILDELHLMLRITDILLRNVILDCKDKDDLDKKESKLNGKNLEHFVKLVDCGVSFFYLDTER